MNEAKTKPRVRVEMIENGRIALTILDPDDVRSLTAVRGMPSKQYNARFKHWELPVTDDNIASIAKEFQIDELDCTDEAKIVLKYVELRTEQARQKEKRRWEYVFNDAVPKLDYVPYTPPYGKHQVVALDAVHNSEFFGILMEMGTGKTWVAINEFRWSLLDRLAEGNTKPMKILVTCPNGVRYSWQKELKKHLPPDFDRYVLDLGLGLGAVDQLIEFARSKSQMKICIVGMDRMSSLKDALQKFTWDIMVVDESPRIKNPSAKRSKAILDMAGFADRRIIMTGSPVLNNIMDLWPQFHFLSPGSLGYDTYYAFKKAHSKIEIREGRETTVGWKDLDTLKRRIAAYSFVVKKVDCLDLPPKIEETIALEMSDKQREMYDQMLQWFLSSLDADHSTASNTTEARAMIAQMMRLRQICCGFIRNGDGIDIPIPGADAKFEQLKEDMDAVFSNNGKLLVWRSFQFDSHAIRRACKELGVKHVELIGETPNNIRTANEDAFNEQDDVRVLLADPGCAGEGKTLLGTPTARCATSVMWSSDFSLGKRLQLMDRNHRIGQDANKVLYYDYVMENSIEERIVERLQEKKDLANELTDVKSIREFLIG